MARVWVSVWVEALAEAEWAPVSVPLAPVSEPGVEAFPARLAVEGLALAPWWDWDPESGMGSGLVEGVLPPE
ncbi:MAG TPA: hypothetical protein PKX94_09420 [Opitutales bacterium]|nr:hypothetical protein [Opitutales bacterium]